MYLFVATAPALEVRPEVVAVPQEVVVGDEAVQRLPQHIDVNRPLVRPESETESKIC